MSAVAVKKVQEQEAKNPAKTPQQNPNKKPENKKTKKKKAPAKNEGFFYVKIMAFLMWLYIKLYKREQPPESVQDTIPYKGMYKDGICELPGNWFNKTIKFGDINYALATEEHQDQILMAYSQFLNFFDESVRVQLTFLNKYANKSDFEEVIDIPAKDDHIEYIRTEYREMLQRQLEKGNNGLVKLKYITFGIKAKNYKEARSRLDRLEFDILNNFKQFNVKAYAITGEERLAVLHSQFHPKGKAFNFKWNDLEASGQSTKDVIATDRLVFKSPQTFMIGKIYASICHIMITTPELSDALLQEFLNMDNALTLNIHFHSVEHLEAIKMAKRKVTDVDAKKVDEQKKAVRSGYDMDILPSDLKIIGDDYKHTLNVLQKRNERLFYATITLTLFGETKQQLDDLVYSAKNIAQKHTCTMRPLTNQQEQGFASSLVIGYNEIEIERMLITSSLAIFVPFTTAELFLRSSSLYYGLNALSNNMIMGNRKSLKNPNGLILGTPGSGKSFAAKREMLNVYLTKDDDIIIVDPEGEYFPLVSALGGQVIKLSTTSPHHLNPMDIDIDVDDEDEGEDAISIKASFLISLCELVAGGKNGLSNFEISIIDRCVKQVYMKYLNNPCEENIPILQDFLEVIRDQPEYEAANIAVALELYVSGSQNIFNHRTNVDIKNRLVCFDIKDLNTTLKKISMLILQDSVWSRVAKNREAKKNTWYYIDEFHLLLSDEQTADYSVAIWKRFRKWGGIPTGITQNVKDLLKSAKIQNIFENSDFILMLNQAAGDRGILAKALTISEHQLSYVTNSAAGEGLIFHGDIIIPFIDKFPADTQMYKVMTTKPEETATKPV